MLLEEVVVMTVAHASMVIRKRLMWQLVLLEVNEHSAQGRGNVFGRQLQSLFNDHAPEALLPPPIKTCMAGIVVTKTHGARRPKRRRLCCPQAFMQPLIFTLNVRS